MEGLKQIINRIERSKVAAGLEIIMSADGTWKYNMCILQKNGSQIEKVDELSGNNHAIMVSKLKSNIPINLVINGHGVIIKKIATDGIKENDLIYKVLPNANEKDFYLQKSEIDGLYSSISLARKELIDKILQELRELKLEIITCYFGLNCLENILPVILLDANDEQTISIDGYTLKTKNGKIEAIQNNSDFSVNKNYKIGDEEIDSKCLLAYSSALEYYIESGKKQPSIPSVALSLSNYVGKRIFTTLSKVVLSLFLLLLLINYFVFSHFYSEQNILESAIGNQKNLIEKYDTLKYLLEEKEDFLKKVGFLGIPKTSFYSDQLAKDVPSNVVLNDLSINPRRKNMDPENNEIDFSTDVIDMMGVCRDIVEFNDWVNLIKKLRWVKDLKVMNYSYNKENGENQFNIEINIK